ncbi:MAG: PHP domain-containing protein [Candidatus Helarchaeota archaeon]
MNWIPILFHVHTNASVDASISVKFLLKYCKTHNIKLLVITDHDSIFNSQHAQKLGKKMGIHVITAVEYSTDAGDVIGLFIRKKCLKREIKKVLKSIKEQNGISVLAHPTKHHHLKKIPFELIDMIEICNSRCSKIENLKAKNLQKKYQKPFIAGSDAHLPWELGNSINYLQVKKNDWKSEKIIKGALLCNPRRVFCKETSTFNILFSQIIKGIREKNFKLLINTLFNATIISLKKTFNL